MSTRWWMWTLVGTLAVSPGAVWGQCMGGPVGGGHSSHGQESGPKSEKKTREAIQRLLADGGSRALLMEAVLADRELMRSFVARIAETPEWRALARERMAIEAPLPPLQSPADSVRTTAPKATPDAAVYSCPMHPGVRSTRPGACPKCGMSLERVQPDPRPKDS